MSMEPASGDSQGLGSPQLQKGPRSEDANGAPVAPSPAAAESSAEAADRKHAQPPPATRKGERFLDPKSVSLYTKDFTIDTVIPQAPPDARTQTDPARLLQTTRNSETKSGDADSDHVVRVQAKSWEGHYATNAGLYPVKNYIAQAFPEVFLAWSSAGQNASADSVEPTVTATSKPRMTALPLSPIPVPPSPRFILECGCGVGSALFPLAHLLPDDTFVGFDISPSAVALLNKHERALSSNGRISAFTHDIAAAALPSEFEGKANAVLLVFVLSAVGVSRQQAALERLRATMKLDGLLCFRDYGRYDHNERRFFDNGNKIADGGYVKGDGTQQCFFEVNATRALFAAAGFEEVVPLEYHCNRVHNRKTDVEMRKVFVNAVFRPTRTSQGPQDCNAPS